MNFLQPILLAALPLAALPIIIHLINQRRYQSVRWGAMMFLLAANKMSRGYARIRQWLILALRVAAIAALIFAVSRPLAGGWLGLTAGGRPDTTLILLDRSASMRQGGVAGSKLETGVRQLGSALKTLGSTRWVLIESSSNAPRELESIDALLTTPAAGPTDAPADLPAMLLAARDYIRANKAGRTEVWICSDLRRNDWDSEGGRWQALRDAFLEFPQGVRFHLLAYPDGAEGNLGVRATGVRLRKSADGSEVFVSLRLDREGPADEKRTVPLTFEIDGARSELSVEMTGPRHELKDHRIAVARGRERGWGRVSIPADADPSDNDFWFVYDEPPPRRTVVVSDDPATARTLGLAASVPPDPALTCTAETVSVDGIGSVDWDQIALVDWHGPLPTGDSADLVRAFLDRGGRAVFFPPAVADDSEFLGVRWTGWEEPRDELAVENWRGDQDLLAHTQSGAPLPVGSLGVRRWCALAGEVTPLATLRGGAPLLARAPTDRGAAYFAATTPAPADSSLATDGVVLYVMTQRALAAGASTLGATRQLDAGEVPLDAAADWTRVAGAEDAVSTEFPLHSGVYASGERLMAVNRPAAEDEAPVLADDRVAGLFQGLDFARVDDRAGAMDSLIQEVWRMFLIGMLIFLVGEAALSLPRVPQPQASPLGAAS